MPVGGTERNFQSVGFSSRIIKIDSHGQERSPRSPFDFKLGCLMLLILPMRVIQRQAASNPVAIIKDDRASRIAELRHLGMRNGFAKDSLRLAKQNRIASR